MSRSKKEDGIYSEENQRKKEGYRIIFIFSFWEKGHYNGSNCQRKAHPQVLAIFTQ